VSEWASEERGSMGVNECKYQFNWFECEYGYVNRKISGCGSMCKIESMNEKHSYLGYIKRRTKQYTHINTTLDYTTIYACQHKQKGATMANLSECGHLELSSQWCFATERLANIICILHSPLITSGFSSSFVGRYISLCCVIASLKHTYSLTTSHKMTT